MLQPIKISLLGEAAAGKTSLVERYNKGAFDDEISSTIGSSFVRHEIQVEGKSYRLEFWDTAGSEKYHATIPTILRSTNGILLLFDLTSENSFNKVNYWVDFLNQHIPPKTPIFLIGNKTDLERVIDKEKGESKAKEIGAIGYYETSAKTGDGVDALLMAIIENATNEEVQPLPAQPVETETKKSCC